jgi:hypothetical protein
LQPESTEAGEAARRLARLLRRRGDFDGCRSVWLTEQSHGASARRLLRAKVELAKLAEHRFRDPVGALLLATEAGGILASRPDLERMLPNTSAALQHRRRRLERRIARRVSKGVTSR